MKKLMFAAAAALCATVGYSDIESANIVGYLGKEARNGLNWYAPMFNSVGYNTTDINSIKLDDGGSGMVGWGDNMQIVGPLGSASEIYCFWDASCDPTEKAEDYYWGDGDAYAVAVSFDQGDGVGVDNNIEAEYNIVNAGEVIQDDVSFSARFGLNWSGNPYAVAININAISLDDGGSGMVGWGDNMQIVGPLGSASEIYCYWDPSCDPTEKAEGFYWGDGDAYAVDVMLNPGDGFAIDNNIEAEYDIKIASPLKK